jgi:hypothetical protein
MFFVEFFEGVDNCGGSSSVLVCQIQEINYLANSCILHYQHVLGQYFKKGKQTPLRIEPGICIELSRIRCTFFWIGSSDLIILPTPKS